MKKNSSEVALGLVILSAAGLLGYMSLSIGGLRLGKGVEVTAEFGNASGLVRDAAVMVAGVEVGKVQSLSVKHDKAVVTLFLDKDVAIRQDVVAVIRPKSLLGEKYLELQPQSDSAPLLATGDVIAKTAYPLEMDQLMNSAKPWISAIAPEEMDKIVKRLATQLQDFDTKQLKLDKVGQMVDDGAFLIGKARSVAEDKQFATDMAKLQKVGVGLLANNGEKIDRMISNGDKMLTALGPKADAMARTLERTEAMTARLEKHLPVIDQLASTGAKLAPTLEKLPGAIDKMQPTLDKLPGMIAKMEPVMDQVPTLVAKLPGTLDNTNRLLGKAEHSLDQIQPLLKLTQEAELRKFIQREGIKINFF